MAQETAKCYPIGIQTFSEIRERDFVYVDKTEYVYKMTHTLKYVFLSRPRRFGKSLLVSTLKSYFENDRNLFKGLAIEKLETEWTEYPVLHFDMSGGKHMDANKLDEYIADQLNDNEKKFGLPLTDGSVNIRLKNLIKALYEKTARKVVVLIDEYDAPLLDVIHEDENLPKLRNIMRNFYSPLKSCDPYLRFVFMTGITKFSQLSIFSELNNIANISMDDDYAAICGITEEEMLSQMPEGIERIAKKQGLTTEETLRMVKAMYDGYHFTWPSPDIYNPYSLVNAFSSGKLDPYWFGSGTPTYLIEMLRKFKVGPDKIGGRRAKASTFDAPTERMTEITPLLYQSGYITITGYSSDLKMYILDIPNEEVRVGLMESLLANYVQSGELANEFTAELKVQIREGQIDGFMQTMQKVFDAIPYLQRTDYESYYQGIFCTAFVLLELNFDAEKRTSDGRIDLVLEPKGSEGAIYIFELKLDKSAEEALQQIEEKRYAAHFALTGRPVIKVGVSIDSAKRNISDWKIA